ncbi:MAG: outer membrane beta-barrel protein [Rikenellaceae bacterium]
MKRLQKILAIATLAIAASTVSASAQIYYGVKGGANVSTVMAVDGLGDATCNYGWQAGLTAGVKVPIVGIGVEAEALYVNNTISFNTNSFGDCEITSNSIEVPVMVSVPIFPMLPISIKAGPSFTLACNSTYTVAGEDYDIDPIKTGVGYTAGIGVKVFKFTFDLRYNGQFSSTTPLGDLGLAGSMSTSTVSASLGYRF